MSIKSISISIAQVDISKIYSTKSVDEMGDVKSISKIYKRTLRLLALESNVFGHSFLKCRMGVGG